MQHELSSSDIPRSVGRVLDLLEIVLVEGSCNLTTAATAADLTPTTARRHLRALEARGYLGRDAVGMFSAGPTMRRFAAIVHDGGPLDRLIYAAQPHLDALAAETGESCYLATGDRHTATYLATAESSRPIRHVGWVGQTVPLGGTAVGAALVAPGTAVIRTGAVEPDITAISLALPPHGSVRAAVSVVGPAQRIVGPAQRHGQKALEAVVAALCVDLGLEAIDRNEDAS